MSLIVREGRSDDADELYSSIFVDFAVGRDIFNVVTEFRSEVVSKFVF
jgi:hypothetical protein